MHPVDGTETPVNTPHTHSSGGDLYGVINATGVGFNNFNTLVRTSALDRTVQSAVSFLSGVFPALYNATVVAYLPSGQQVCSSIHPPRTSFDAPLLIMEALSCAHMVPR